MPTTLDAMSQQTSEDGTIGEMWKNALEEFEKLAPGKSFKDIALSTTPEDLRKKLDALNDAGKGDKNSKSSRAKEIGLKVLDVVKTLGGVAAEAAGMVFGPAQVCFGALSIFLSIPRKVREFHEFIELVFIELDPVLSQFDIYINMEKTHTINDTLRIAIHKVMANFVSLCATVVGIQQGGKWDKFKKHASRVFGDDQELQEELERFRRIVNGLQNIQLTATYEGVVETRAGVLEVQRSVDGFGVGVSDMQKSVDGVGTNVKKLVDEQSKRTRDDKKKAWLASIRKDLGIEDDNGSPKQRQEKMAGDRLKDTGTWLFKDDRFKKWADRHHSEADSILFLTGLPGFGKSSLISAVVDHLREQAATLGQDRRSLLSFHFLPMQKDKKVDQENAAETSLKWMAYQLAEQDDALCKSLALLLPDNVDEIKRSGFAKLWEMLKVGSPSPRTTNYLIFDDVDKFSDVARQEFAKILAGTSKREGDQCSLKILVCGNVDPKTFGGEQVGDNSTITIDVDSMRDDLRAYINKQLLEQKMLPGPGCADLRQRLEEKMLSTPGCNFRTIDIAMKGIGRVIATSGSQDDMFQTVDRSTQDEDDVMRDTLDQLQADLTPSQIALINEILIWVVFGDILFGSGQFNVSSLQAALCIRKVKLPIEGLANFVASRARGLMHTVDFGETIVLEEGAKKALIKPRAAPRQTEPPRINLEIKIVNSDLPTARRFFWDLAKYATLDHFDLSANSPNAQATNAKGTIAVNEVDAHLALVQATLEFLSNPPSSDTEDIGPYFIDNLAANLKVLYDAKGLDAIDNELKAKIGKSVYNLFADPRVIKRHWTTFEPRYKLLGEASMSEFWRWLGDKSATSTLGTKDEEWLNKRSESDDPTRELLEDVMEIIARLWLEGPERHDAAVCWIREFLSQAWKATPEGQEPTNFDPKVDIAAAEAWCRKKLNVSEDKTGYLWHERLARTYKLYDMPQQAIYNYRISAKLSEPNPASWDTAMGLGGLLFNEAATEEKELEALAMKEEALNLYLGPEGSEIPVDEKLAEVTVMARSFQFLRKGEEVAKYHKLAFDLASDKPWTQYDLLASHIGNGQESEAQALLKVLAKDNPTEGSSTKESGQLVELIRMIGVKSIWGQGDHMFWRIVSAATNAGILDTFLNHFEVAIERYKTDKDPLLHLMLVLLLGSAHFSSDKADSEGLKSALELWTGAWRSANEYHASGNTPREQFYEHAAELLGKYYFTQVKRKWGTLQKELAAGGEVAQLRRSLLEDTQKLEQIVADYEQVFGTGSDIESSRCYKASFLAIRGNHDGARGVFKSDMVQVVNMLSDDEQSNDSFALIKLQSILLHSGNSQDAFAAYRMTSPPSIGNKVPGRMRMAMDKLLCPGGTPEKESPTSRILELFDAERGKDQPAAAIITGLISEAAKYGRTRSASEGESAIMATNGDVESGSVQQAISGEGVITEDVSSEDKEWVALHKVLTQLQAKDVLGNDYSGRWCNNCLGPTPNLWDFDNDFYTCKYCYDMDLCEKCFHELKAADPEKMHPVCSPTHDWLYFPKWTIESWTEAVRMMVRLPRENDQGVLVPGDETVELPEWLNKVTAPWGGLGQGKMWDHVKTPPEKSEGDGTGSETGREEEDGGKGKENEKDGAETGKEDANGARKTDDEVESGKGEDGKSGDDDEESTSEDEDED